MKRLLVLSLVAVLSVGLLSVGALAAEKSGETFVSWNYTCNAAISVHTAVTEGDISPNVNNVINFDGGAAKTVSTQSNCGYDVYVKGSEHTKPAGAGDVLNNFNLRFTSKDAGSWQWNNAVGSFAPLSYNEKKFGKVSVNNANGSWQSWKVKYQFDADGMPAGQYRVDLTYTMTTTD